MFVEESPPDGSLWMISFYRIFLQKKLPYFFIKVFWKSGVRGIEGEWLDVCEMGFYLLVGVEMKESGTAIVFVQ